MKPTIKNFKKVLIKSTALLLLAMTIGNFTACNMQEQSDDIKIDIQDPQTLEEAYDNLRKVANIKMPTYEDTFKEDDGTRKKYLVTYEEDVIDVSATFKIVIEDYFKACGASDWTNPDAQQFWPEDVEYMVAAMAFCESSYRTNCKNDTTNCAGLTGINKDLLLTTLSQWLTISQWAPHYPQAETDPNKVDMFNPTTAIEYTYYNIGYNLANIFKKDKTFIDNGKGGDGKEKCVWDQLGGYSADMQKRLLIAAHRYGINNVINSIYDRNYDAKTGNKISLNNYIYSGYTEDVLNKMNQLKNVYDNAYHR